MSHFTVLVASKSAIIDDLLEPYNENMEVEPYWADDNYDYLRDNPLVDADLTKDSPIEDVFSWVQEHYADDDEYRLQDGVIQRRTTYNPDSKWDYWCVGGRWAGQLELTKLPTGVDQARKSEVDIEGMRARAQGEAEAKWAIYEDLVEKHGEVTPFEEIVARYPDFDSPDKEARDAARRAAREEYHAQPVVAAAKEIDLARGLFNSLEEEFGGHNRESYLEMARLSALPGYAFLSEETGWIEPGRMGWFGISSETRESRMEYLRKVNEIIDSLPDDTLLTVVDCHI